MACLSGGVEEQVFSQTLAPGRITQIVGIFFRAHCLCYSRIFCQEAICQASSLISAAFTDVYSRLGPDGAVATILTESYVSALLLGAPAYVLDFSIRSRLVGYHDTGGVGEAY